MVTQFIQRAKHEKKYFCQTRESSQDSRLSLQATGLLSLLLSFSDNWRINVKDLHKRKKNGREATRNALNELIEFKYIYRETRKSGNLNNGFDYYLWENPYDEKSQDFKSFLKDIDSRETGFWVTEDQNAENPSLNSIRELESTHRNNTSNTSLVDNPKKSSTKKEKDISKEAKELAQLLRDRIAIHSPGFKEPNLDLWAKDMDKLLRLDKRTPETIRRIILWACADVFWQGNILSPKSLRSKFDQLNLKEKTSLKKEDGVLEETPDTLKKNIFSPKWMNKKNGR